MCRVHSAFRIVAHRNAVAAFLAVAMFPPVSSAALPQQRELAAQLAELAGLRNKVGDADTRVRVDAFHRVWTIALASETSEVKLMALELLKEPVGSSSDHIRMPAVYAITEIANSTTDQQVKLRGISALREPMIASQLPIRLAAVDAVSSILRGGNTPEVLSAGLALLGEPVRSGNNGVRIPAIHAVVRAVEDTGDERAYNQAIDLMTAPLNSMAAIGGMEVRLMAVVAVERIGVEAKQVGTKSKAMGLMQSYATKSGWEPEARKRALEASTKIQDSIPER
jgi:hypothetical protein